MRSTFGTNIKQNIAVSRNFHSMNQFVNLFGQRIKDFWSDSTEQGMSKLLEDILNYANSDTQKFKKEFYDAQFDKNVDPLPVVLEALSKDTDNWGNFFVDQLEIILNTANSSKKPSDKLTYLLEYSYIAKDHRPFVQRIVDRLYKEIDSANMAIRKAAIWTLPVFLNNHSIRNKSLIIDSLHKKLNDKS